MKQLSGLDASFLYIETPEMPMHVGALHVFELPAGYRGRFANQLRKHVAARLPVLPVLRRKLAWMPLNLANPAWVDAEPVLKEHIVEVDLPRVRGGDAGSLQALEALVARLHVQLLDRSRPLWKFHVIEGLAPDEAGRRRVAMYTQLHHAAVDGQAAMALAAALFDVTAQPRAVPLRPARPARSVAKVRQVQLGMAEMLSGAVVNQVQQLTQLLRSLPATVGALSGVAARSVARSGREAAAPAGRNGRLGALNRAPRTSLNASVTAERAFAAVSLPLEELRTLGRRHEATVNDVVLWLCSTALRRHFGKHGPLPRQSLVAAVPVSLRQEGDAAPDNQASLTLISLGTHIADPLRRLQHIKAATASMKATLAGLKSVLPTDFPSMGVPWLLEAAAALIGRTRAAERIPALANLAISNVPGPAMPLYLAGARMLRIHPASIVVHGMALNITVQSYDQAMDFGLMACAAALPQVRDLARAIDVAFDDLRALSAQEDGLQSVPGNLASVARHVLGQAMDTAVRGAARAVPKPVTQAARAARQVLESSAVQAAAASVPRLAREAVSRSVARAVSRKPPGRSR
jgi:diacylglycerol O-acyltransferase